MNLGKRAAAVVAAAAGIALLAATLPEDAEAHGRRGPGHGPTVVVRGGGFYGAPFYGPYWGFGMGWGPYFGGGFGFFPPILAVDLNLAAANGLGVIDLRVKPGEAEVWLDGKFFGEAKDFDGTPSFLWLKEGPHRLVIYRGGYKRFEEDIEAQRGQLKELKVRLEKGESVPPGTKPGSERPAPKPVKTEGGATD
jgi:hypothetical protein